MASYKSYNLARCPIFVLYLDEEGICPILFLKMSYKSYDLGLLSYNVLYFVEKLSYNPVFFSWKVHGHPEHINFINASFCLEVKKASVSAR